MASITDATNRVLHFPTVPHRVVCLIPSITESLFELGLGHIVSGITKFCIHPKQEVSNKTKVGGTKDPDFNKITEIDPDLIIMNIEENKPEHIDALSSRYKTWVTFPKTASDAAVLIEQIGRIFRVEEPAGAYANSIYRMSERGILSRQRNYRTLYLIWRNPWMSINSDTFIHHMMQLHGMENVFADKKDRYFSITEKDIKLADPEVIILPDEPFRFKEKHKSEFSHLSLKAIDNGNIFLADGTYFCWYGTRTAKASEYIQRSILNRLNDQKVCSV